MKNILNTLSKFFSGEKGTIRAIVAWVALILVIAIPVYLFDKTDQGTSGWDIVKNQTAGEWFRMIFYSILAGGVVWAFIRYYKKVQNVTSNTLIAFAFAFMVFLGIAFGKSCTDKANDGVTSGKGRPTPVAVDSNRVAAEDLLPKK